MKRFLAVVLAAALACGALALSSAAAPTAQAITPVLSACLPVGDSIATGLSDGSFALAEIEALDLQFFDVYDLMKTGIYSQSNVGYLAAYIIDHEPALAARLAMATTEEAAQERQAYNDWLTQEGLTELLAGEPVIPPSTADTEALSDALNLLGDLLPGGYTKETWTVFEQARKIARLTLLDGTATQDEVNQALKRLLDAYAALIEVDNSPPTHDRDARPGDPEKPEPSPLIKWYMAQPDWARWLLRIFLFGWILDVTITMRGY